MNTNGPRISLYLLIALAVGLSLFASIRATARYQVASPTPVAVIDWLRVTDELDEWKDTKAGQDARQDEFEAQNSEWEAKLRDMTQGIGMLPEGSEARENEAIEIGRTRYNYQAWAQFESERFAMIKLKEQIEIYLKINLATTILAQRDGWSIVLWDDSQSKTVDLKNLQESAELISRRQVIFTDTAKVDITDTVIQYMNNEYNNGG